MSEATTIQWTDSTWNPVRGCTKVSAGCKNCYAERFAERWRGIPGHPFEQGFDVRLVPEALDLPLRWRKSRRVFVNSMSDLFHEAVPDSFIVQVFEVMAQAQRHTFQILTKRAERMREWFSVTRAGALPNVWLGVSVEDQRAARERIPHLLATPAAVRFLSCEPLLGPVDLRRWLPHAADREMIAETTPSGKALSRCRICGGASPGHERECRTVGMVGRNGLHWVIVGGESGPGARPMHPAWARALRDQCAEAGVPYFFKQWGEWGLTDAGQLVGSTIVASTCRKEIGTRRFRAVPPDANDDPGRVEILERLGKKRAGREFDGRTHDEMPEVSR